MTSRAAKQLISQTISFIQTRYMIEYTLWYSCYVFNFCIISFAFILLCLFHFDSVSSEKNSNRLVGTQNGKYLNNN